MKNRFITLSLLALVAAGAAHRALGQSADVSITLITPGVSDWNTGANWLTSDNLNVVPGNGYPREVVSISNGGTSFLSAPAPFEVDGVLLGDEDADSGTLEIRAGGSLELADAVAEEVNRDGTMIVGNNGTGNLLVNGGALIANGLIVGGQSGSKLTVNGASTVNIAGNAVLGRTARVEGPAANITVGGSLWVLNDFQAKITGATHSAVKVPNGAANVAGALELEFSGVNPALGNSWTLINAKSVVGEFSSVSVTGAALQRGLVVTTQTDSAAGDIVTVPESAGLLGLVV